MCGIAGVVGSVNAEFRHKTALMGEKLAHRGPDGSGLWADDGAALVHRRLSIIDVSESGHQPMVSTCGRYILVFNGEIHNYRELRNDLVTKGMQFRGHSDSEVLLAAFVYWGERCVSRLNGMWAFAIWDRVSRRLFVSRDRFGQKPFYYVTSNDTFWFASEIKALLHIGVARRIVNPRAVADFAAERVSDHSKDTFFTDVFQLPAATSGWVQGSNISLSPYWSVPEEDKSPADTPEPEEIESLLEDAVRLRLRSDVPVGTLLSGGLDSSSVTCLAADLSPGTVTAFSTLDRAPPKEADGIQAVLDAKPCLQFVRDEPDDDCLERELMQCLWFQEEPFADGSMLAHFRLMRLARDKGVRVLLTGQAADEVFGGYPGYLATHLGGLIRHGALAEATSFYLQWRSSKQGMQIASVAASALPTRLGAIVRSWQSVRNLDWLAKEFRSVSRNISTGYASAQGDPLNSALRACLTQRTLPSFLHYEDRNGMSVGVETRTPFLDHRLVEMVLPTHSGKKLQDAKTKALLRAAMSKRVPSTIVNRLDKDGYPAPLARWLRKCSRQVMGNWVETVRSCPLVNFAAWDRRRQRFMAGHDADLTVTWRGLILALWYREFILAGE